MEKERIGEEGVGVVTPESRKRILDYQKRRDKRLKDRGLVLYKNKFDFFRSDADDDDNKNNNGNSEKSGGHGNTKLPFGLCMRYGIEVGADWTPRDAWDALKGKGITPDSAFEHLGKGEDPGEPDIDKLLSSEPTGEDVEKAFEEEAVKEVSAEIEKPKMKRVKEGDFEYEVEKAVSGKEEGLGEKTWALSGTMLGVEGGGGDLIKRFPSKDEMYRYLKEAGIEEFPDPETGEIVNPTEMELPPKKTWVGEGYRAAEYGELRGEKSRYGKDPWDLYSKKIPGTEMRIGHISTWPSFSFKTKEDMLYWLKDKGVEEFPDPETGEIVNPKEMELPERDLVLGDIGYRNLAIGLRDGRYTITGEQLDGKKKKIQEFLSLKDAQDFLDGFGVNKDKVKLSPALKKREAERVSWLTSDKTEYVTSDDGIRYGDLIGEQTGSRWELSGEDENGFKKSWSFRTKAEMMKFMKEQGCEKVRIGKDKENPMEYEIPPSVAKVKGQEFQEIGLKYDWDEPYLYGIDLDGREKPLLNPGYRWTVQKFLEFLRNEHGIGEESLTMTDEVREKLEEQKKKDEEKEKRRQEFEAKAVEIRGRRVTDPYVVKDEDGDLRLVGYDEDGDPRPLTSWSKSWRGMDRSMSKAGLDLGSIVPEELRGEYDEYVKRRDRFERDAIDVAGYRVVDPYIFLDSDGTWAVRGYDEDDDIRTMSGWGGLADTIDWAERYGLKDIDSLMKGDAERAAYEKYKKAAEKFDAEAVQIGDRKYLEPYIFRDSDGTYQLRGTTRAGETKSISPWCDLYDLEEYANKRNIKLEDYINDDKTREDFQKYKKARESFDKEAVEFGDGKYVDLTVMYNPSYKEYEVTGRDAKGRFKTITKTSDWQGMASEMERYGVGEDKISLTDEAKEQRERALKAKELIDSGGWYSFGSRDEPYKDIEVTYRPEVGSWLVEGTDMDEKRRAIGKKEYKTWDDAISAVEQNGVGDYKVKDGDKEIGKPKWGMHKVMLMRKPEGGYIVFADSKKFGDHAVMFEDPKEENARAWLEKNGVPLSAVKTRGMNPNDDKPRTHTAKSLEGFDKHRADKIESFPMIQDMTDAEKKEAAEMLTDMFRQGAYRMRRKGHFEDIFDGRFKSLLETGTSGGSTMKSGRRETGVESFGHDYDIKPKDGEKYGYLGVEDDAEAVDSDIASWYGSTIYKFKKDRVGDRVTYSFGDTLDAGRPLVGYAGDYPTIEGLTGLDMWGSGKDKLDGIMRAYRDYKSGKLSYSQLLHGICAECRDGYIETHYHGDLTLKDVDSITFPRRGIEETFRRMTPEKRKKVVDFLRENNIKLQYYDRDSGGERKIYDGYKYLEDKFGGS